MADAGYGSEENYEMLEQKGIDAYVKYNYFHKDQKRKSKNNPFLPQNLFYNSEQDFYVCPMGQRMERAGTGKRVSQNGYESQTTFYQAKRCEDCPLRGMCHQAQENRRIEVNHRLNVLKTKARELLTGEKGLRHRSRCPIEPEAVFGQLKSNNKFNRFTFSGLEKVTMEFLLMAIGHNFRKMAAASSFPAKTDPTSRKPGSVTAVIYENYLIRLSVTRNSRKSNFIGLSGRLAA